jgi:hypothetical protein
VPRSHEWFCEQSPSEAHGATLQAAAAHAHGLQLVMAPVTQAPAPSHIDAAFSMPLFPEHVAAAQTVPPGVGEQTPSWPATAQELQAGQAATPQQKPSVQWPLTHWPSSVQAVPFPRRFVHEPPTQLMPAAQSPAPVHMVRHMSAGPQT